MYLTLRFEPRWLRSLSELKIPIQLLWGDSDSVSPLSIPTTLAQHIPSQYLTVNTMKDTGEGVPVSPAADEMFRSLSNPGAAGPLAGEHSSLHSIHLNKN